MATADGPVDRSGRSADETGGLPCELFRGIADVSPTGLAVLGTDACVEYVNPQLLNILRIDAEEFQRVVRAWASGTDASIGHLWASMFSGELEQFVRDVDLVMPGGERIVVVVDVTRYRSDVTQTPHVVVRLTDATSRRLVEDDLRAREAQCRLIVETLPGVVYTAEPGPGGRWTYVSPQIEQLLGFTAEEWMADPLLWVRQLHEDDREAAMAVDQENIQRGPNATTFRQVYRMRRRDGSLVWVRDGAAIVLDDSGDLLFHGVLTDVTHEKALEERLEYLATHDQLTGLLNRSSFAAALTRALADQAPAGRTGVCFIDLDRFKQINDSNGHSVGDQLLRQIGRSVQAVVQPLPGVVASRIAGDEFAVLGAGYGQEEIENLGVMVLAAVKRSFTQVGDRPVGVGASVGAVVARSGQDADEIIAIADRAMYRAKARGGGQVEVEG